MYQPLIPPFSTGADGSGGAGADGCGSVSSGAGTGGVGGSGDMISGSEATVPGVLTLKVLAKPLTSTL
jgi:hypothetical protein